MFKFFKKKSEVDKLYEKYDNLIKKSYEMSHVNRAESDILASQAQSILDEIEKKKK